MSNPNDTNAGQEPNRAEPPRMDQTFVEGSMSNTFAGLRPGVRVDATSLKATNPYASVPTNVGKTSVGKTSVGGGGGGPSSYTADALPSGNDPIPLASGTIVAMVGAGGMARVYKIWNEKLEVFRAVKILIPNNQSDLKNRFETEAKITAKLHHPNIVEIYSVGDWNNLPYLEMEFIDGHSLESFIHKYGKLPDSVCSSIAIHIARALSYAHSQEFLIYGKNYHGVIHRDLKPANIMISSIGDVKLMDFGIARPTEASLHTVEGNIVGTMQYLSPEQMDGVDIDCRTDLYSFGAILYEMLTGTKTFPQDTITNLMKKKIMNEYRRFTDFEFNVCPALARIAQKCLQLSKQDRYANAEEMLRDLEAAHKSFTPEAPMKVMRSYLKDPNSIEQSSAKALPAWLNLKIIIPAAGVIVAGLIVMTIFLTGPKEKKVVAEINTPVTTTQPQQQTSQHSDQVQQNSTSNDLKPLAPSQTAVAQQTTPVQQQVSTVAKQPVAKMFPVAKPLATAPMTAKPPKTPPSAAPKAPEQSSIEKLSAKYNTKDPVALGKSAVKDGLYSDAIEVLESAPDGNDKTTLLLEAYMETSRNKDALYIINSQSIPDAQFDYLCGRVYQSLGKGKQALEFYETALTKPSTIRNRSEIRNDALFQTAVVLTTQYRANPSQDARFQALNAWNTVKRIYMNNPENARFKKANTEMASIQ